MTERPAAQLAFATDANMHWPTLVAIYSTLRHLSVDCTVYIFGFGITDVQRSMEDQVFARFPGARLVRLELDADLPDNDLGHAEYISPVTMARMFLPKYVSGRLLYLDGDMLITGDLAPLLARKFDQPITGVRDYIVMRNIHRGDHSRNAAVTALMGKGNEHGYINAGMLLMDCDALRPDLPAMTDFAAMIRHPMRDQDRINELFLGRIAYVDPAWNSMQGRIAKFRKRITETASPRPGELESIPARVIHYNGPKKPWQSLGTIEFLRRAGIVLAWRRENRRLKKLLGG